VQLTVPIRDAAGRLNQVVGPITISSCWGLDELALELRTMAEHVGDVVEQLQKSQREILRAEQLAALGQLAAGLAHELRNPLMSVKLLAQAASERYQLGLLRAKDLLALEEVSIQLERSVQTILDFARPPRLEKSRFHLAGVIEQTAELISVRAMQQGVQIELEADAGTAIEADAVQLRQVLLNVLLNALDATPGGGFIRLHSSMLENGPAGRKLVKICISDTGCGLPFELGDRVFEPFVSTKDTGVGLGLSISKRIIELHGGTITAQNGAAGGALITIFLPCLQHDSPLRDHTNQSLQPALGT
jgi:signal transduction histidine kinase